MSDRAAAFRNVAAWARKQECDENLHDLQSHTLLYVAKHCDHFAELAETEDEIAPPVPPPAPGTKLWLWRHFVDGKREYWAFDSLSPVDANGDPLALGEPAGYALVKSNLQQAKDVK